MTEVDGTGKQDAQVGLEESGSQVGPSTEAERLRYRLLTGPDDSKFCERVSAALDEGYELSGSPAITFNGTTAIVAQALILPS